MTEWLEKQTQRNLGLDSYGLDSLVDFSFHIVHAMNDWCVEECSQWSIAQELALF